MKFKVVFENENWIAIDKPSGVLSVPGRFAEDSRPVLGTLLQRQLGRQIFPVHRLDFEVSGVILFAKSAAAHRRGNAWFENKEVSKTYFALSEGVAPNPATGQWKCLLLRGKKRAYESPAGKSSLTEFECLGVNDNGHLRWYLNPVTGRAHQLRYELFRHECPILGDSLYSSQVKLDKDRIALRAFRLDLRKTKPEDRMGLPEVLEVSQEIELTP